MHTLKSHVQFIDTCISKSRWNKRVCDSWVVMHICTVCYMLCNLWLVTLHFTLTCKREGADFPLAEPRALHTTHSPPDQNQRRRFVRYFTWHTGLKKQCQLISAKSAKLCIYLQISTLSGTPLYMALYTYPARDATLHGTVHIPCQGRHFT
jgi:hypothetical protein